MSHRRPQPAPPTSRLHRRLDAAAVLRAAALAILLLLAFSRTLLNETLLPSWTGIVTDVNWPTPATSMGLTAWILVATACWLLAQAFRPQPLLGRRALWPMALLAAGLLISTLAASDKAAARNAACNLAGIVLAFWLLVQLLDTRFKRQLALLLLLASGTVFVTYALQQKYVDNPHFVNVEWPRLRDEFFRTHHVEPDSAEARQFNERVGSAEVKGFALTANIGAAAMLLVALGAAGWSIQKWRGPAAPLRRVLAGIAAIPALAALWAVWLTGSRGGILATAVAAILLAALAVGRRWFTRHRRGAMAAAGVLVACVALGVVLFCVRMQQPAPGSVWYRSGAARSLLYRWQYWTGAARIVSHHPFTGIGGGNFRTGYLHYKLPEALEDPRYAHNFAVQSLAEFGPAGCVGLLWLLGWIFWRLALPAPPAPEPQPPRAKPDPDAAAARPAAVPAVLWLPGVVLAGLLLFLAILPAAAGGGLAARIANQIMPLLVGPICAAALLVSRDRLDWPGDLDEDWVRLAIGCGLAGFLLACSIDFAMFQAGPATLFWSLAAVGVAGAVRGAGKEGNTRPLPQPARGKEKNARWPAQPPRRKGWTVGAAAGIAALVAFLAVVYTPVARVENRMASYFAAGQDDALPDADFVLDADPLEPTLPLWLADQPRLQDDTRTRLRLYRAGLHRDPDNFLPRMRTGQLELALAANDADRSAALALIARGVEANPASPYVWQQYGDALLTAGRPDAAADAYAQALRLDDIIRACDVSHNFHLSVDERAKLNKAFLSATSAPASTTAPDASTTQP